MYLSPDAFAERLAAVDCELGDLLSGVDVAAFSGDDAQAGIEAIGHAERRLAGLKILLAGRLPDDTAFAGTPDRSAARWMGRLCGTSVGEARDTIAAAHHLDALPVTGAAVRAGLLSGVQARVVADAAAADPISEGDLLHAARTETVFGLRAHADRVKSAATGDDERRHRRAKRFRHLRFASSRDGCGKTILGEGPADDTADVLAALRDIHQNLFSEATKEGDKPSYDALMWDALVALARNHLHGDKPNRKTRRRAGAATKVIVRVDYESLVRGHTISGETCEIAGVGPVPVPAVADIIADGDPFLAAVVTKAHKVAGVVHFGRRPTEFQKTALEWLHPTCAVEGCDNTILDFDHEIDWAASYQTLLEDLDGLCGPDHSLKDRHDWRLVRGQGKRPFVPPSDPRHPGKPQRRPPPRTATAPG